MEEWGRMVWISGYGEDEKKRGYFSSGKAMEDCQKEWGGEEEINTFRGGISTHFEEDAFRGGHILRRD